MCVGGGEEVYLLDIGPETEREISPLCSANSDLNMQTRPEINKRGLKLGQVGSRGITELRKSNVYLQQMKNHNKLELCCAHSQ